MKILHTLALMASALSSADMATGRSRRSSPDLKPGPLSRMDTTPFEEERIAKAEAKRARKAKRKR